MIHLSWSPQRSWGTANYIQRISKHCSSCELLDPQLEIRSLTNIVYRFFSRVNVSRSSFRCHRCWPLISLIFPSSMNITTPQTSLSGTVRFCSQSVSRSHLMPETDNSHYRQCAPSHLGITHRGRTYISWQWSLRETLHARLSSKISVAWMSVKPISSWQFILNPRRNGYKIEVGYS